MIGRAKIHSRSGEWAGVAKLADARDLKGSVRLFTYKRIVEHTPSLLIEVRRGPSARDTKNYTGYDAEGTVAGTEHRFSPS